MVTAVLSDLHGLRIRFQKARRLIEAEGVNHVLVAGDIAAAGSPEEQVRSVRENFGLLLESRTPVEVFAIPGNDDWKAVEKTLREFPEVTVPAGKTFPLTDSLSIIGYPFVPITPFLFKDYEKWDSDRFPRIPDDPRAREAALIRLRLNLTGYRSFDMEVREYSFDPADRSDTIAADLKEIATSIDPKRTICLFHCPPHGFHDFGISGSGRVHIGSRAVFAFIAEHAPWLTIHGHSHEAVKIMGGECSFRIGGSLGIAVGPGNDPGVLAVVLLDPESRRFRRFEL